MTAIPSTAWLSVFPAPRISDVLAYMHDTWNDLRSQFPATVEFRHQEPNLTDNLCEAMSDQARRLTHRMDCDFLCETWELVRNVDGTTKRIARADIRVILGAPGTPHLVIEFKKLDGSANARWRYCFDGMNRFVAGRYAATHEYGVMCSFVPPANLTSEGAALESYVSQPTSVERLKCLSTTSGLFSTNPSGIAPVHALFDTEHHRSTLQPPKPITLLHAFVVCT